MSTGLLLALAAALAYGAASVLQSVAARRAERRGGLDPGLLLRLAGSVPYVGGLALDGFAFLASVVALRTLPLFLVQAAVASSIGVTAVLATVLGARLRGREVAALAVLGAGLVLLAVAAQPEPAAAMPAEVRWLLLALLVPLAALGWGAARRADAGSAPALAVLAGAAFSVVAISARGLPGSLHPLQLAADPLLWTIVGGGTLGMLLFTLALQRGTVTTVTAVTFAVDTVVPALVGLALLHDAARPGLAPVAAAGFVLALAGALSLARRAEPALPG